MGLFFFLLGFLLLFHTPFSIKPKISLSLPGPRPGCSSALCWVFWDAQVLMLAFCWPSLLLHCCCFLFFLFDRLVQFFCVLILIMSGSEVLVLAIQPQRRSRSCRSAEALCEERPPGQQQPQWSCMDGQEEGDGLSDRSLLGAD